MDAIEFVKQLRRMNKNASRKYNIFNDSPEDVVSEVEQWSKEHPRKTRQSVFLEAFPNVGLNSEGVINILPCRMDTKHYHVDSSGGGCKTAPCVVCMQEFWMQEVE